MTSDFAPEVAKYPQSSPKHKNSAEQCVSLSSCSVSEAASQRLKTTEMNGDLGASMQLGAR